MSHMPTQTGSPLDATERRHFPRHQVKSLAYLDIGPDNGGIVLNISERGLAVHAVSVLPPEPVIGLRIQLPKSSKRLETRAKVAWTSGTKKEAGVEFIDLPEEARLEIVEWLSSENVPPAYIEQAPPPDPPQARRATRTDKWTSLVGELTSAPPTVTHTEKEEGISPRPLALEPAAQTAAMDVPLPDPAFIFASEESAESNLERDFAIAETLTSDASESRAEPDASRESEVASSSALSDAHMVGDPLYRRGSAELSLPSDTLLNTPLHPISIVPSRAGITEPGNGSRSLRDLSPNAAPADDFLKKARALFGPKRVASSEPATADLPSILESMPESSLVSSSAEPLPTPLSEPVAKSDPSSAPSHLISPATTDSIAARTSDSRRAEVRTSTASRPVSRGLDLRSTMGIFALCVVVAVVCIGLGIVVGRNVSKPAQTIAASGGGSPQPSASASVETDSHLASLPAAALTRGRKLSAGGSAHRPTRRGDSETTPVAQQQADNDTAIPPSTAAENGNGNATTESQSSTAPPLTPLISVSNGISVRTSPAMPNPLPQSGGSAPSAADTAPRAQAPSERLVAAHLIYRVEPFYPRDALRQRVEGTVRIHATVGQDGRVKNLRVVSGPASLTSAALDAAQYWRYIPALRNGEPVEMDEDISIEFHLMH